MWKRGGTGRHVMLRGKAAGRKAVIAFVIACSLLGQLRKWQ
jgi:hypothetical protein